MGVLIKKQIIQKLHENQLSFSPPLDVFQLRSHAVDLRLGFTFMIGKKWILNEKGRLGVHIDHLSQNKSQFEIVELEQGQYFEILPNEFIIVSTLERLQMPNDLMAVLYPRSSINRQGLSVDLSGIVDAGYVGNLIIPIRNNNTNQSVRLYPGERFCQLVFHNLNEKIETVESRYHNKDIFIGRLPEKDSEEIDLLKQGDIKTLKKIYKLDF